jgi:hypothetical protein
MASPILMKDGPILIERQWTAELKDRGICPDPFGASGAGLPP